MPPRHKDSIAVGTAVSATDSGSHNRGVAALNDDGLLELSQLTLNAASIETRIAGQTIYGGKNRFPVLICVVTQTQQHVARSCFGNFLLFDGPRHRLDAHSRQPGACAHLATRTVVGTDRRHRKSIQTKPQKHAAAAHHFQTAIGRRERGTWRPEAQLYLAGSLIDYTQCSAGSLRSPNFRPPAKHKEIAMRYENKTFSDVTVLIDDNEFINCTFERCVLSYAGGSFSFGGAGQRITPGCSFQFSDHAARTFGYLQWLWKNPDSRANLINMLQTATMTQFPVN